VTPSQLADRLYRNARIGWTALCVWLRYKTPLWWDRLLGRDPDLRDMNAIHQRNADQIFRRGSMCGMPRRCQVVGTRPTSFLRSTSKASQRHDRLPPRASSDRRW
jgi:hypothetical protein